MKSNQTAICAPLFRVLSDDQIQHIHLASLEILERTGVEVQESEALASLAEAGGQGGWLAGEDSGGLGETRAAIGAGARGVVFANRRTRHAPGRSQGLFRHGVESSVHARCVHGPAAGSPTYQQRLTEKVHAILENHRPQPLSDRQTATIRDIIAKRNAALSA